MNASELADKIMERRTQELAAKIKVSPRSVPILSDLSDCDRQIAYGVLDWEKRPAHNAELQARFDAGNMHEREIVSELMRLGFDVVQSQAPVEIKNRAGKVIARGRVDGFIRVERDRIPFEVKSMHPSIYDGVKSLDDFRGKPWLRKYTRQLMLYLYGNNAETGLFILTNGLGAWKLMALDLDYAEAEHLLQRLERVDLAIAAKAYPDRIPYDQGVCGKCPFAIECLPDMVAKEAALVDNDVLEAEIARHEELRPLAKEYDELHDKMRQTFAGVEKTIVGGAWLIENVQGTRVTYNLPEEAEAEIAEIKKAHAVKVPVTRLVIEKLKKQTERK